MNNGIPATEIVVIGAGAAGAGVASELAQKGHEIILLDQYDRIPYGSTGRSAALFAETYFSSQPFAVLTAASKEAFIDPSPGFTNARLVNDLGAVYVAGKHDAARLADFWYHVHGSRARVELIENQKAIRELVPIIRPRYPVFAVLEPEAKWIDVNALHEGFRRRVVQNGGEVWTDAEVLSGEYADRAWRLHTKVGAVVARTVIDASGPWGDIVGGRLGATRIGLKLLRRTAIVNRVEPVDIDPTTLRRMPFVFTAAGDLYFRLDSFSGDGTARMLISPSDETPTVARDEQPEQEDIARAVQRFHDLTIAQLTPRPDRAWAGIRPFAPDRRPVVGYDPAVPSLFRLLGHGGYGIQTAPALSRLAAALVLGEDVPEDLVRLGINTEDLSPGRFASQPEFSTV